MTPPFKQNGILRTPIKDWSKAVDNLTADGNGSMFNLLLASALILHDLIFYLAAGYRGLFFRDAVLLNAAAALVVADKAASLKEGVEMARVTIDSGAAKAKIEALKRLTHA